jgi:hypothetical protein
MSESAINLGNWLASDSANLIGDRDTLSVLVLNAKTIKEITDLVTPLSKKLKNGVSVWAKGSNEKPSESPSKIKFQKQQDGSWDLVVFSTYSIETSGNKSIGSEILHALTLAKLDEKSRIIVCVPTSAETGPIAVRVRV